MCCPPSREISINRHNYDFIRFLNENWPDFLVRIDFLVPFSLKRKSLAALHSAEFRRFPPASPYRVFHLGNCKSSLGDITQRMRRESYRFHLEVISSKRRRLVRVSYKWPRLSPEKQATATTFQSLDSRLNNRFVNRRRVVGDRAYLIHPAR